MGVCAETYVADPAATDGPGHYLSLVARLQPGDTLELPAGMYRQRLDLSGLRGTTDAWITIAGPTSGEPAVVTTDSSCCNVVQLGGTAFVAIKFLTIDGNSEAMRAAVDGVNAKGGITHDITIEGCVIRGVSYSQQTVGIATRSMAWSWIVRGNTLLEAGTGMYLGDSDGSAQFVAGTIEGNLFVDTIGYNVEVKFQKPYVAPVGMPTSARTIIRDNVFMKRRPQSSWPRNIVSGARPNLLVGGFPASGAGADNLYEIARNFFFANADGESLLQASGRVAIHDNVFVATTTSLRLVDHDLPLQYADVYNNTFYGGRRGIVFESPARQSSRVVGNLVFAAAPISGPISTRSQNVTAGVAAAVAVVAAPSTRLGAMDFYPRPGQARGEQLDLTPFESQIDFDKDFNGRSKGDRRYRGAYAGEGANPGWKLDASRKALARILH